MIFRDFMGIPEGIPTAPKIGDKFLHGASILEQKNVKYVGQIITYYEVIAVKPTGNIEYIMKTEVLTED